MILFLPGFRGFSVAVVSTDILKEKLAQLRLEAEEARNEADKEIRENEEAMSRVEEVLDKRILLRLFRAKFQHAVIYASYYRLHIKRG